jgi:NitT/TauT family transport system ATP-binding protein
VTIVFITHDIDEAVYLGERVLVLSNSPSVVQADITVDLPVARDQLTTRATAEFAKYRAEVYSLIQRAKLGSTSAARHAF